MKPAFFRLVVRGIRGNSRSIGYALAGGTLGILLATYLIAGDAPSPPPTIAAESSPAARHVPAPVLDLPLPMPEIVLVETPRPAVPEPEPRAGGSRELEPWQKFAVGYSVVSGRPRIVVVIDDMGLDKTRTARVIALPGPLTTSFLTYADDLETQTRAARKAGHELLVHVPMEPMNGATDAGRKVITGGLSREELSRRLDWALGRFPNFVGINNHMGSRFTADREGMTVVMSELKRRGLLFLDSRTTAKTVADSIAQKLHVPYARRHVFLDDSPSPADVARQMREAEEIARRDGFAVVIGHPRDATIVALRQWLSNLERRGFSLVPISAVAEIRRPRGRG